MIPAMQRAAASRAAAIARTRSVASRCLSASGVSRSHSLVCRGAADPTTRTIKRQPARYFSATASSEDAVVLRSAASPSAPSSFSSLGLTSAHLLTRLKRLGITQPTEIQARAVPTIMSAASVLLGAETGCGKTLAYLLPVVDRLLRTTPTDQSGSNSTRRYPRVIIFVPNRELGAQLDSVLSSLLGSSGAPITVGDSGSTVSLHWSTMFGTQIFPIQGKPNIDILITTPTCLAFNIPFHDLLRARSKRNKEEAMAREAGVEYIPTSTGARFDMVSFVRATETVIMDEIDFLLEGDAAPHVKHWIQDVWMQRRRREKRPATKAEDESSTPANTNEETSSTSSSLSSPTPSSSNSSTSLHPSTYNPQLPDRQFIFVGATLTNLSPQTCFQWLLDTFTPHHALPTSVRGGRGSRRLDDVPKECTLVPVLSSQLHHVDIRTTSEEQLRWIKVGPIERVKEGIDEERLSELLLGKDATRADEDGDDRPDVDDDHIEELNGGMIASRKRKGGHGDRFFKAKNREAFRMSGEKSRWGMVDGGEGDAKEDVGHDAHDDDIEPLSEIGDDEKVGHTITFLNHHTPKAEQFDQTQPPRKSLIFVSSVARLKSLEKELRSAQSSHRGRGGAASLSPHIELLTYHADLKPRERVATMATFNSSHPSTLLEGRSVGGKAAPSVRCTHQILLCTSLVARGLDFDRIMPPPAPLKSKYASAHIRAGFTSLTQFDMAKNVIDYIHRVGRMWRYRGGKVEHQQQQQQEQTQEENANEEEDVRVLNLYTAVDDLLVSHIRGRVSRSGPMELSTDSTSGEVAPTPTPPAAGFISNDAFSRKRRLQRVAKRRAKAEQQRHEEQEQEQHQQ